MTQVEQAQALIGEIKALAAQRKAILDDLSLQVDRISKALGHVQAATAQALSQLSRIQQSMQTAAVTFNEEDAREIARLQQVRDTQTPKPPAIQ